MNKLLNNVDRFPGVYVGLQPSFSSSGHRSKLAPAVMIGEILAVIGSNWRDSPPITATDVHEDGYYTAIEQKQYGMDFRCNGQNLYL